MAHLLLEWSEGIRVFTGRNMQPAKPRRAPKATSRLIAGAPSMGLAKAPSGIRGLDEITGGGLPRGRATLVAGGPGCGKTLFGMEFLVRGTMEYGEPGVFVAFEETPEELAENVASLGFDLRKLEAQKKLSIDYVRVERSEIEETGEYDLEGLFIRLDDAIQRVGAKRVVLDTVESLFSGLPNPAILRSELRRLFRWLKDRKLTIVITAEQGAGTLTREGLEEYVSDCVIFLDHRVVQQTSTRRLRVVKYRGSLHGTNEYPFLIDQGGISILPVTSLSLAHKVSSARTSSGIPRLDEMLGGHGYFKGSTILVSGTAGTGKTTLAAAFAESTCARGEKCLYFAYEESAEQIVRNMRSVGIELGSYVKKGILRIISARPTSYGLEMHLVSVHKAVNEFRPDLVIIDPITNLTSVGTTPETRAMLTRVIDFLKLRGTTAFMTSLTGGGENTEKAEVGISSLVDTWILLSMVPSGGERNRTLTVIKSRGMAHSNQAAEFVLSSNGLNLLDTYVGPTGVLTGSARVAKEAEERTAATAASEEIEHKERIRSRRRKAIEAQIASLQEKMATEEADINRSIEEDIKRRDQSLIEREAIARSRHAFFGHSNGAKNRSRR